MMWCEPVTHQSRFAYLTNDEPQSCSELHAVADTQNVTTRLATLNQTLL